MTEMYNDDLDLIPTTFGAPIVENILIDKSFIRINLSANKQNKLIIYI